ncbi:MAG: anion permease [Alphaproteobacteria bacterium]|nr:anion permease [Alphaproteobacteria bacterium]
MHFRLLIPVLFGSGLYFLPVPEGLDPRGWHLFAIFVATIAGIILKAMPMGAIAILSLLVATLTGTMDLKTQGLSGYGDDIIWLVVYVFFIARGFINSQLGTRVAYIFIRALGRYSLGLGYGVVLTELLVAPLIPSNSARAGGIIYPILKSMAESLGSRPGDGTERKIGSFLMQISYHANLITSAMFLTAMAANPMVQKIAASAGAHITWSNWFIGAIVPGLASVIVMPLVIYFIYPPEVKVLPNAVQLAKEKLIEMGAMKPKEWIMICVFSLMLGLWIYGKNIGISAATTSLLGLSLLLVTGVLTFDDMLKEKDAWHTLIWFAILVTMANYLSEFGFVGWFSGGVSGYVSQFEWHWAFLMLVLVYFYSHYLFASNTAHVSAMYGAFLTVAISIGTPPLVAALIFGYCSSLFSHMTHYGSSSAVVLFGTGYVPVTTWWFLGFIMSIVSLVIWLGLGGLWWKMLGWW